jgi:hypothetical protein
MSTIIFIFFKKYFSTFLDTKIRDIFGILYITEVCLQNLKTDLLAILFIYI